jgi:hypothetical protein
MSCIEADIPCVVCGESLRGAALRGECLECGRSVGETLRVDCVDPMNLTVAMDVRCAQCGYNVRTQPIAGVCPECAAPVHLALRRSELSAADVGWLRRVRRGVRMVVFAEGVYAFFATLSLAGAILQSVLPSWMRWIYPILTVVITVGTWLATGPELHRAAAAQATWRRRIARIGFGVGCVIVVIQTLFPLIVLCLVLGVEGAWEHVDAYELHEVNPRAALAMWLIGTGGVLLGLVGLNLWFVVLARRAGRNLLSVVLWIILVLLVICSTLEIVTTVLWHLLAIPLGIMSLWRWLMIAAPILAFGAAVVYGRVAGMLTAALRTRARVGAPFPVIPDAPAVDRRSGGER